MRYGIVVEGPQLPSAEVQRTLLARHACDVVVEEPAMTPDAHRRLTRLIARLKRGDELVVHGLGAFGRTTGGLAQLLREIFGAGVAVMIVDGPDQSLRFGPDAALSALVGALADHEASQNPSSASLGRRRGEVGRRLRLTAHQIDYARKLHAEGASAREIGLLFQAAPDDISRIVDR